MPTWRQLKPSNVPWEGTVVCQNACIVREAASLDSEVLEELLPGTRVTVVQEEEASGRRRLCLSSPLVGWVTAKFVQRIDSDGGYPNGHANGGGAHGNAVGYSEGAASLDDDGWKPLGESTFFPSATDTVTEKTPMGRPVDIFQGHDNIDLTFGSPAWVYRDRVEMAMWIARRVSSFKDSLGDEVNATLMNEVREPSAPSRGPQRHRPQVLYIAGVEGTGHHGVMPMVLYPAVRKFGAATFSWWRSLREVLMKTRPSQRRERLKTLLEAMGVFDKPHFIMEWASWPFGEHVRNRWCKGSDDPAALLREERSHNPGNSVDLMEFIELFREHADVKVLVLHRNLLSAAWSHKEWDDGLVEHAKVLALFNDYLTKVLRGLEPSMWRWVAYEDLCEAWGASDFEAADEIAEFLGLPQAPLSRAFRYFKPSRKDAAAEMSPENLRTLRDLDSRKGSSWFPSLFPQQRLLRQFGNARRSPSRLPPPKDPDNEDEQEDIATLGSKNPAFQQLWETMTPAQRKAWGLVEQCSTGKQDQAKMPVFLERFTALLSEDQRFMLHKAMLREKVGKRVDAADVDFSAFGSLHFWIEDRGFGSEVNNLVSAAIACEEFGLHCVVEDEVWNSGRLHTYLQAEPLILRRCPDEGTSRHRPLEVRRDRRVATPGWFAVCKHAKGVSFAKKSKFMRRVWRYTTETRKRIDRLNEELRLPPKYIAMQVRRGDKVAGNRKESVQITGMDFAREAQKHLSSSCSVVVVCTDDVTAAEEVGRALRSLGSPAEVRWRSRAEVPANLRNGHWQANYNALSAKQRIEMTHEFLADVEVLRCAEVCLCTFSSNVGRLVALLRDQRTDRKSVV